MKTISDSGPRTRPFACYDAGQLGSIRERVAHTPEIKKEYERQRQLSEQYIAQEVQVPMERIHAYRTDPFVVRSPRLAAFMKITIHIVGKGAAWIGQLQLTHSERGIPIPLANATFHEGLSGWEVSAPEAGVVPRFPSAPGTAADAENALCLFVRNPSESDHAVLRYSALIPVRPLEHYSIQTTLRLDESLSDGVYSEAVFLNEDGKPLGEADRSAAFNRQTPTTWAALLEIAGADADLYMVTGNKEYADRAKQKLLYMLADMCQGMDIFKATGWHVDDIYGAVHIGRGLAVTSVIYDQIADSGMLAAEEETELLARFRYIAKLMMDTGYYRFDLEEFPDEKGGKRSNWNADRATGLGVYSLIFPGEEHAAQYLEHACAVVDWQLEHVVDRDGAWPENIRYHGAVLHRYFLFFVLLQRWKGKDYFSHPKVKLMYRFLIGTAGPKDVVQGALDEEPKLVSPAVGDSNVNDQWFRLFAYSAPVYTELDPPLSREMMWAWNHGGRVVRDTGAFPCTLLSLLYPVPELPEQQPVMESIHYPHIGYILFRQYAGDWGRENFAIYESSPLTYHAHHDEGHFSIWANSTPLTLDPGTGGYYNGDRHWYLYGHAHNVVQFEGEAGTPLDGPLRSVCEEVLFSEKADYVRSRVPDPRAHSYHRHFVYMKSGIDAYVVWDRIRSEHDSVWNLHTLSSHSDVYEQGITAHCLNGMKLEVTFLEPGTRSVSIDRGAVAGAYPLPTQQHFQIRSQSRGDYVTLLCPVSGDAPGLTVEAIQGGSCVSPELRMYKLKRGEEARILLLVNSSEQEAEFTYTSARRLHELLGESSLTPGPNGEYRIRVGAGRMVIASLEE